jgi:hypothetical protein
LKYEIIFLPYKPKAEDKILSIDGKEVAPLTRWIFKEVNPFALGMQKSGEMAYMRAILTYGQKVAAGEKVVLPGIIVLDSKDNICSEEITKEYKDAFHRLNKGEIKPEEFELRNRGYKHIADIRPLEGNYIGIKLSSDDKGNKITSFGKTPSSFVTDATVESGAMTKFAEGYQKMLDKRAGNVSSEESSANISIEDTVSVPDDELPF